MFLVCDRGLVWVLEGGDCDEAAKEATVLRDSAEQVCSDVA